MTCPDLTCDTEDCAEAFERLGRHHAIGLLLQREGKHEQAIETWVHIMKGEREDEAFPGLQFLVKAIVQ